MLEALLHLVLILVHLEPFFSALCTTVQSRIDPWSPSLSKCVCGALISSNGECNTLAFLHPVAFGYCPTFPCKRGNPSACREHWDRPSIRWNPQAIQSHLIDGQKRLPKVLRIAQMSLSISSVSLGICLLT